MEVSSEPDDRTREADIGPRAQGRPSWLASLSVAVVLVTLFIAVLPGLPALAESDGLVETSRSTFRLLPGQERVGVRVDITQTIRVGESLDDPTLAAHELAHAWFDGPH
jgi:hypothetical protein